MKNLSVEQKYLITLLRCAIKNETSVPPADLHLGKLYSLAKSQSVIQMIYTPLINQNKLSEKALSYFEEAFGKATAREANQEIEIQRIMEKFDEAKVRHMPLKGFVLKNLYPLSSMRTSCDVDILYEPHNYKIIKTILLHCGYYEKSNQGNHAVFYKMPIMNIEMHNAVFLPNHKYSVIFSDIWNRAKPCEDSQYKYCMTPEDLYLHAITHTAKHFEVSGTGIRSIIDMYFLIKTYGDKLNRNYINDKLAIVDLNKFAENIELTTKMLFDEANNIDEIDNEVVETITEYLLSNGSYGTIQNNVASKMLKNNESRIKTFFRNVFLNYDSMRAMYKWLKYFKFLLPVAWVIRIFKVVFINNKIFIHKLKTIRKADTAYVKNVRKISGIR